MGHLILKGDGKIEYHYVIEDENEELHKECKQLESKDNLIPFFCYDVQLDSDYTLRSFFNMLEKYEQLQSIDPFLVDYLDVVRDFKNKHEIHRVDDSIADLKTIVVGYVTEVNIRDCDLEMEKTPEVRGNNTYYTVKINRTPKHELSVDSEFHPTCYALAKDESDEEAYGISFISPVKMLHLPIEIKPAKTIFTNILETHSCGDIEANHEYDKGYDDMTLYDFVYGISDEMCFHGTPEGTQEVFEDLERRMEEVRRDEEIEKNKKNDDDKNDDNK